MLQKLVDNEYIQNIVLVIFIGLVIYILYSLFYKQDKKVIEGMANKTQNIKETLDELNESLDSIKNTYKESLHIDKYKSDYENAIINMDEALDLALVSQIIDMADQDFNKFVDNNDELKKLNDMMKFKDNLNVIMQSLDKIN